MTADDMNDLILDSETLVAVDGELAAVERALAAHDPALAGEALARAVARLDSIDDGEGEAMRLGSRIIGSLRGIRALFERGMDAAVSEQSSTITAEQSLTVRH